MDKDQVAGEIKDHLDRLGVEDTSVRIDDMGVTLSLENIQFDADSAVLLSSEKAKLDKIGEILQRYPNRDILVGGHTAMAGTATGRMRLSQQRAAAVADYLIGKKVRPVERIVTRGFGAERPLGDNNTEAGKRINRRVEITILEN
jgi:outer membrane protein OmpA-like peptidoglycan-associated protein